MNRISFSSQDLKVPLVQLRPLQEISDPPKLLFAKGDPSILNRPCIAIVGTRRPSLYGIRSALYFSKKLASIGFTIVSGLARGIDSYAHRGALLGKGMTAAVLGHGLSRVYPPENKILAQMILQKGGLLLSEYEPSEPPMKHYFPQRNRIISGLSLGVLIVEAAEKSGSLITAQAALDQNREVFVVGSRFDEKSFKGGNLLLQQGAKMVLSVEDILEEFPLLSLSKGNNGSPIDESFERLKQWFDSHDGIIHLAQIYLLPRTRRDEMLKSLHQAIQESLVIEISQQQFLWLE